ncbi:protein GOLM2 isoform X3 [Pelobates fuscus]|uniref:protein GOLM2 isoform X3 n=1 Tax=Pelobates fuscus TaxID=191477 RepID=UPI002FE4D506
MVGFGAPRRTGRLPPFVLIALLAVIGLLAFNYWSVSARQAALQDELLGLQAQVQRIEVARSRLEKRNSEMVLQADSHRRQMEQRQGEYQSLGERLQARDGQAQRCEMDRAKLQSNISHQMVDISHFKEQLAELKQEFLRQEDQLRDLKNNNTFLQKTIQEESQQCTQQLEEQKRAYEERLKKVSLGEKITSEKPSSKDGAGDIFAVGKIHAVVAEEKESKVEEPSSNRLPYGKDAVKGDGDAGMPEIEDSDPAREDVLPTAGVKVDQGAVPNDNLVQMSDKFPSVQTNSFTEAKVKHLVSAPRKADSVLAINPFVPKQSPKEAKALEFPNVKQKDDVHDGQGDAAEYRKDRFGETL